MLAYTLKEILTLVPEALPLVKEAHVDQEMPLSNRDSCIATALQLKYHEAVEYKPVDVFSIEKVAKAVRLYGVEDVVSDLSDKLVKAANERKANAGRDLKAEYLTKQAAFDGEGTGFPDPQRLADRAAELYKEAQAVGAEPSENVLRYSGHGFLSKEAAVKALAARFQATKNPDFVKIASALNRLDTLTMKSETIQDICSTVTQMDKEAGLHAKGFDFYREAILTKEAAVVTSLNVKLCGKEVPYESILRVGRDRIAQYIGEDVAKEIDAGPMNAKQVLETLPLDLQRLICDLIQNV